MGNSLGDQYICFVPQNLEHGSWLASFHAQKISTSRKMIMHGGILVEIIDITLLFRSNSEQISLQK